MPRCNGCEMPGWLRGRKKFKELPVVMLSGSDLPQDMARARELGATDYAVRTPTAEALGHWVRTRMK